MMKKTKEITIEQLKQVTMNDIDKKVIICTGGQLIVADLPEHGVAGIRTSNSKYQRVEYDYTVK